MKSILLLSVALLASPALADNSKNNDQNIEAIPTPAHAAKNGADVHGVDMHDSGAAPHQITDAEIVAIVKAANDADIEGGKLAEGKTKREDVKAFAQQMVKDHTDANTKLAAVMKTANIQPQPDDISKGTEKMAVHSKAHLESVKAKNFDHEYMLSEQTMHQQVLDSLDNDLIPNAKNANLKSFLKDVRPVIAEHLANSKKIYTALTKPAKDATKKSE